MPTETKYQYERDKKYIYVIYGFFPFWRYIETKNHADYYSTDLTSVLSIVLSLFSQFCFGGSGSTLIRNEEYVEFTSPIKKLFQKTSLKYGLNSTKLYRKIKKLKQFLLFL